MNSRKAGRIIKKAAVILLIVTSIAAIVGAVWSAKAAATASYYWGSSYGRSSFDFKTFMIVAIVGIAASLLCNLLLYGFGCLVEDTSTIQYMMYSLYCTNSSDEYAKEERSAPKGDEGKMFSLPDEDGWACTKCGTFNHSTAEVCKECGKPKDGYIR